MATPLPPPPNVNPRTATGKKLSCRRETVWRCVQIPQSWVVDYIPTDWISVAYTALVCSSTRNKKKFAKLDGCRRRAVTFEPMTLKMSSIFNSEQWSCVYTIYAMFWTKFSTTETCKIILIVNVKWALTIKIQDTFLVNFLARYTTSASASY